VYTEGMIVSVSHFEIILSFMLAFHLRVTVVVQTTCVVANSGLVRAHCLIVVYSLCNWSVFASFVMLVRIVLRPMFQSWYTLLRICYHMFQSVILNFFFVQIYKIRNHQHRCKTRNCWLNINPCICIYIYIYIVLRDNQIVMHIYLN